jgi:DNA-binding MarR family transcriptional regulator
MNHNEIIIHIRKIVRSLNLESRRTLKKFGVSIPQLLCIQYLASATNGQASHKEVAGFLNLNSSTVTGIIGRLEKKGLVSRLKAKDDKRIILISLTENGTKLLAESPELIHHQLLQKLSELPDNSLAEINNALEMLVAIMGIGKTDASPILTTDDPINTPE